MTAHNNEAPWWTNRSEDTVPRAWWLGLFWRPLRLTERSADRLPIPTVTLHTPQHQSLDSQSVLAAPQQLSPRISETLATNLTIKLIPAANAENGSVDLFGALLNTESSPRLTLPRPTTPATQPAFPDTRPSSDTKLPLWKRLAYLLQPPTDLLLSNTGPLEWPSSFFSYQLEGIYALMSREALLLADDMGLGKTIQTIAALRLLVIQRQAESALLIARAGLIDQWRKEFQRWAPELRIVTIRGRSAERVWQWNVAAHVYLISYETFRTDFTSNLYSPPRRRVWDVVILDEAQAIKNREAEITIKCKQLYRRRAWALAGTPLENSVDDLASILEFVTPFVEGDTPQRLTSGPALHERQAQVQLRRKKSEVLPQLPPKIVSRITLKLDREQQQSYQRAEREGIIQLREKGDALRVENVLELITRLKQLCNFCPRTGRSAKLEDLRERLRTLVDEGHRALVFSQFADNTYGGRAIVTALAPFRPLLYIGDLSAQQKEATIRAFKQNPAHKVLVLSLRAGGQGLNLQEASYVFHFDRWWNPAIGAQAEDRSHRFGQNLPANIYSYVCENTIEERIERVLQEKQLLFDELVDDVSLDLQLQLTREELFGLLGLTPPPTPAKVAHRKGGQQTNYAEMNGIEFERHVKRLLEHKGWRVETTPVTRDRGIDLIARREDTVGVQVSLYVQCKNHAVPVGVDVVRELNGALPTQLTGARGVLVCSSGFTAAALAFAKERDIALWDRHHLFTLASEDT
ncbi:MAG: SNF2-related protein [Candidatus Binatia bacterium]